LFESVLNFHEVLRLFVVTACAIGRIAVAKNTANNTFM